MAFSRRTTDNAWYLDLAAEVHITYDRSDFTSFVHEPLPPLEPQMILHFWFLEKVQLLFVKQVLDNGMPSDVGLCDEHLSPGIYYNLLSLGTIEAQGYSIQASNDQTKVTDNLTNEICMDGTCDGTSYKS